MSWAYRGELQPELQPGLLVPDRILEVRVSIHSDPDVVRTDAVIRYQSLYR